MRGVFRHRFRLPQRSLWVPTSGGGSAQTITPTGIASAESFGSAAVSPGAVSVAPTGIAGAEAFGTASLSQGFVLQPTGIASAESFGTAVLSPGAVSVVPTGIASAESIGSPSLALYVVPTGITSAEALGTLVLTVGAVSILASGIASAESFGTLSVAGGAEADVVGPLQSTCVDPRRGSDLRDALRRSDVNTRTRRSSNRAFGTRRISTLDV